MINNPGCIYTTQKDMSAADLKKFGNIIMGCQDVAKDKVNGRTVTDLGEKVCLSNGNGCGDCLCVSFIGFPMCNMRANAFIQ